VAEAADAEDNVIADVVGDGVEVVVGVAEELNDDNVDDGTELPSAVLVASPAVVPL
jgi:hypothetical protein